jgi:hypothetical protein
MAKCDRGFYTGNNPGSRFRVVDEGKDLDFSSFPENN